ncbi:MAG: hypothetical protein RLZZ118_207 [Bacteroidota bacterium]
MKKILLCCSLLMYCICAMAQQDFLYFKIQAEDNQEPIAIAKVNAYCANKFTQFSSDSNGNVTISIAFKNCMFSVEAAGYDTKYNIEVGAAKFITIVLERRNTQLQDIVVTGQAKHVLAEKSIYKVNVINAATLRQQAANNLGDALATQNNFFKQNDNILGSSINMQGIGGQNIKILLNGVPMNGRENGNIDISQINVANVERIEIIKGPMSVLYGTDALGGVINIITKTNTDNKRLELQAYAESNNKINNNISFGMAKKRHSFSTNLARNFFGGYLYTDTFNRAQLWKPKDQYTLDANYTYATSKGKFIYTPSAMFETILNRGTPNVDAFGAYGIDEYYKTKRIANTFIADVEIDSTRKLTFSNNVSYYSRIKNRYAKDLIAQTSQLTHNAGDQDTSVFVDYNFRGFYHAKKSNQASFMVGYEISAQTGTSNKLINNTKTVLDFASYISVPMVVNKKLSLQPAVRVANNTFYKAPITPSFNLRWALAKQVILRASYARGFRAPSLKELYLNFVDINHNITGNDSLLPEKSHQLQLHVDAPIKNTDDWKIKIGNSTFYNIISNQISLAAVDVARNMFQYANVDNYKNICNETNVQLQYKKWRNNVGVSINSILTADSGRGFNNVELLYTTNYPITKYKAAINFNYRYIGKQAILGLSTIGRDATYNAYLPPMHLADINISKQFLNNKLQVQVGMRNIFGITSVAIQGNANTSIHGGNGQQNVSPGRSGFVNARWAIWQ